MMEIIWAVAILTVLGFLLGLGLSVASKVLYVEVDTRVEDVTAMLPNANCGGCGYPGCAGFAEAIVEGKVANLSACRPGKPDKNFNPILKYMDEHPNADGSKVNLKI